MQKPTQTLFTIYLVLTVSLFAQVMYIEFETHNSLFLVLMSCLKHPIPSFTVFNFISATFFVLFLSVKKVFFGEFSEHEILLVFEKLRSSLWDFLIFASFVQSDISIDFIVVVMVYALLKYVKLWRYFTPLMLLFKTLYSVLVLCTTFLTAYKIYPNVPHILGFFIIILFSRVIENIGHLELYIATALTLEKMPLVRFDTNEVNQDNIEDSDDDRTCIICRDEMVEGVRLKCGHCFHADCIKDWLERSTNCPVCRSEVEFEDMEEGNEETVFDNWVVREIE
ncbi:E3 ubiquitin protein ligase hrd-1 [Entamoeba marina]